MRRNSEPNVLEVSIMSGSHGELMTSRRRFLLTSTVAAGAALAAKSIPRAIAEDCRQLPPSISELKSMKDQAKPIAREEFAHRQQKARELMQANDVDAMLLM